MPLSSFDVGIVNLNKKDLFTITCRNGKFFFSDMNNVFYHPKILKIARIE